jgi:predicted AAA+ superfamily ATPase
MYLNWDHSKHRKLTIAQGWTDEQMVLIFDELHKYKRWKGWLMGIYDVERDEHAFIVAGSARLVIYRRGGDIGAKFENLVACHLLKRLQFLSDSEGEHNELRYIRDKDKREVDFVIIRDKKVDELIEVKYSDTVISKSLVDYTKLLKPRLSTQIVCQLDRPYIKDGVRVTTAIEYFSNKVW